MKVLVIDDHPLVRDAMAQLLMHVADDVEVLQAADCAEGLHIASLTPDLELVLLDLNLPGVSGISALDRFRNEHPAAPVVIVSAFRDRETIFEAIRRGAMGYVPKSTNRETFIGALRTVLSGTVYLPQQAAHERDDGSLASPASQSPPGPRELGLTERQAQVLALLMKGRSNKEICRELGLAERTVKVHLTAVLNALRVSSRTQAVIAAARLGLEPENLLRSDGRPVPSSCTSAETPP